MFTFISFSSIELLTNKEHDCVQWQRRRWLYLSLRYKRLNKCSGYLHATFETMPSLSVRTKTQRTCNLLRLFSSLNNLNEKVFFASFQLVFFSSLSSLVICIKIVGGMNAWMNECWDYQRECRCILMLFLSIEKCYCVRLKSNDSWDMSIDLRSALQTTTQQKFKCNGIHL